MLSYLRLARFRVARPLISRANRGFTVLYCRTPELRTSRVMNILSYEHSKLLQSGSILKVNICRVWLKLFFRPCSHQWVYIFIYILTQKMVFSHVGNTYLFFFIFFRTTLSLMIYSIILFRTCQSLAGSFYYLRYVSGNLFHNTIQNMPKSSRYLLLPAVCFR